MAVEAEDDYIWEGMLDSLNETLSECRTKEEYCDCKLIVGGSFGQPQIINAHRVVLLSASGFFEKKIMQTTSEYSNTICLPWVSPQNMEYVLDYIYTGKVSVPDTCFNSFMRSATLFELRGFEQSDIASNPTITNNPSQNINTPEQTLDATESSRAESPALSDSSSVMIQEEEFDCLTLSSDEDNDLRCSEIPESLDQREYPEIRVVEVPRKYMWYKDIDFSAPLDDKSCEYCPEKFRDTYTLDTHKEANHIEQLENKERTCKFVCAICKIPFPKYPLYKIHMDTTHPFFKDSKPKPKSTEKAKKTFQCEICGREFLKYSNYSRHIEIGHKNDRKPITKVVDANMNKKIVKLVSVNKNQKEMDPLYIKKQDISVNSQNNLSSNANTLTPLVVEAIPTATFVGEPEPSNPHFNLAEEQSLHRTSEHVICPNTCKYIRNLPEVLRPKKINFNCIYCTYKFLSLSHLNRHMESHASVLRHGQKIGKTSDNVDLFWCGFCGKTFASHDCHDLICGKNLQQ